MSQALTSSYYFISTERGKSCDYILIIFLRKFRDDVVVIKNRSSTRVSRNHVNIAPSWARI